LCILKIFSKISFLGFVKGPLKKNELPYSDEAIKELLYEYHKEIKIQLKRLLVQYFKVRYNPELSFDKRLLEELGFKPCQSCFKSLPQLF